MIFSMQYVICVDLGTFCSTFCAVPVHAGHIAHEMFSAQTTSMSGAAVDVCVLAWLIKDFERRNRGLVIEAEDAKCRLKLLKELSRIKQVLSAGSKSVRFDIESLCEGVDYHFELSRAKFESIIYDVVSRLPRWLEQQMAAAGLSVEADVMRVVVSGGVAEIPKVRAALQGVFGHVNAEVPTFTCFFVQMQFLVQIFVQMQFLVQMQFVCKCL